MNSKLTHHLEQLGAGMAEFTTSVLAPAYRAMVEADLPTDVTLALLESLQSDFLALVLERQESEDDGE